MQKYILSGNAATFCPVIPYYGLLWYSIEDSVSIPMDYPLAGRWGRVLSDNITLDDNYPLPFCISACWLSLAEERFFICEEPLNMADIEDKYAILGQTESDIYFVMGFGANGLLVLWLQNRDKSFLIGCYQSKECNIPMSEFMPVRPDLTTHQLCELINNDYNLGHPINIETIKNRFADMMKQYIYKYVVSYEAYTNKWDVLSDAKTLPDFCWIKECLFDGTFDKVNNDNLLKYHQAGVPEKLSIKWYVKKSEYIAYFFIDETPIISIFKRFLGNHLETKVDFIIRIDAENKKYELSLYRQGLKEPVIIPEDAYQLIVFKNKFEDYRSENYNQPRGAWIW